jgi:dynein heavy chain
VSEKALGYVKENILNMQKQEAKALGQRQKDFDKRVFEYRNDFMKNCPYHEKMGGHDIIIKAYAKINEYFETNKKFDEEAFELNNLETLFDIEPNKYKALGDCKKELEQLKYLWDLISLVDYQFANWSTTLWDKIDPDNLEMLVKNFSSNLCNPNGALNKEIKLWKAFMALNDRVKNMAQVMPLVKDLNSEFMKPRHWQRLKDHIERDVPYDQPTFCLNDLLKCELHKHVDYVTDLVDSAGKEHKIEIKIK